MNKIIVFEGVDGVGKTTQMRFLSDFLSQKNVPHIATQEFSGDVTRKSFRELFMNDLSPLEELSLINLARSWHMRKVIQPALAEGKIVLIDRFIESTWAYQGGGRGISSEIIQFMQDNIWNVPTPDLTIFLDGRNSRAIKQDRFEHEDSVFFDKVRSVYMSRKDPSWFYINSNDKERSALQIKSKVSEFLKIN